MVEVVANYEKRLEAAKMPPGRKKVLIFKTFCRTRLLSNNYSPNSEKSWR